MRHYPLAWIEGKPKTLVREPSRFRMTYKSAHNALYDEAERLHDGPGEFYISTNVPVTDAGIPIVSEARRVTDPGVAVYVCRDGTWYGFGYDKFVEVRHNLRALSKLLEHMRGIAVLGDHEWLRQSLQGFCRELPAGVVVEARILEGRAA